MARFGSRPHTARRRRLIAYVVACAMAGALTAVLILPQYDSNATTSTASTTFKSGVNETNGSTAASSDAAGGAKSGTAKPGDTLKWTASYQNNTAASASVNLTDVLTDAGTYVPGSLQLPPNQNPVGALSPQYSTDGGTSWTAGAPPAGASGVGFTGTVVPQGTQQLSLPFVTPPAAAITMAGGDAYNAVVYKAQVYALNHHRSGRVVYCARLDGTTCVGWPTDSNLQYWSATPGAPIGTGTTFAGSTAQTNGTWVAGDKLYWYAGPSDSSSAGLGCLDLSPPTPISCGYLPRTGRVVSNTVISPQVGGTGIPSSDGNRYSATTNNGSAAIMCVTPTGAACTGVPSLIAGVTSPNLFTAATFGDYVFASIQQTATSNWKTYCYNVKTSALCTGATFWPTNGSPSTALQGNNFAPVLSTVGALIGVCTITNGAGTSSVCWNLAGTVITNPYAGTGANFNAGGWPAGDAFVLGAKVYLSNGDQVMCRDFGAYSGTGTVPACAGFTTVPNSKNYTVRSAEGLDVDCLVASGDVGQIRFFNALSGGSCTNSGPQAVAVDAGAYYCGTGTGSFRGWNKLSLLGAVTTAYTSALVTLRDQNGVVIPNFDTVRLSAGATLSLTAVPASVTSLSATVSLIGVRDPAGVKTAQISISWQGDPPQLCFRTTAPPASCDASSTRMLSNTAKAVTVSAAGSDAPGGNSTGAVQFAERADPSQCSLAIQKTSPVQTARPGDKLEYAITVRNTGTQAYDAARFVDDLTDVLTEAVFVGDQRATTGTLTYAQPILSWSGPLPAGASATITYSVTVISPDPGDHHLVNTVVSTSPQSNCAQGSVDPACTTTITVQVSDLLWHKVDATDAKNILPGAEWTLTPVDAAGTPTGPAIVVSDCTAEAASACTGADTEPVGGLFRLTNLGPGSYRLVETRAPVGFVLNPTPIAVTIGPTTVTVPLADIVNTQLPVPIIPLTGGLGTDLLTLSGSGLMTAVLGLAGWQLLRRVRAAG